MSTEKEDNVSYCTVDLKLYSQNEFHPGFWVYRRNGIGRVVKSNLENIYFVKVMLMKLKAFIILDINYINDMFLNAKFITL